jgi:2-oxoglutarate ferredoxin oxidoreductase subunit gamma
MENSYLLAGFGGQGVQTLGQLLTYAATDAKKYATYLPAYGGEMRGGTSNCTVKISDEEIGSPAARSYNYVVVLNVPSYNAFKNKVKPEGTLFVNSNLILDAQPPEGTQLVNVPLTDLANEAGSQVVSNVLMFGLLCAYTGDIDLNTAKETMLKKMAYKEQFIPINTKAFELGVKKGTALK